MLEKLVSLFTDRILVEPDSNAVTVCGHSYTCYIFQLETLSSSAEEFEQIIY